MGRSKKDGEKEKEIKRKRDLAVAIGRKRDGERCWEREKKIKAA